ncbi:type II toxin-antitoxin system mRNA interferase toxin, RelE/StbE family [Patescibacteria group bacterium]|nr:type II toxin-antitoxin system mRNA interferase toxin, RelE/StbE family [Patescibacteria group bacterium]MBU1124164.1 type II toxin-antitoxin system mRNA interferase toxin, RelE/StbE family [Patescibacteria group bacterium]MBU1911850.1 type II toxin-antitoxin system mRNA interferase toxin, RelE/StbE family [Patescibacteria group bacterium]
MKIAKSPSFKDSFEKRGNEKLKSALERRLKLFVDDPFHKWLHNHPLKGEYAGHRSINITGDYRAIYIPDGSGCAIFIEFGTHDQLYGK